MTSAVGGLTLPVPSGGADAAIVDPVVIGLLDYCAYWIRDQFNAKGIEQRPAEITDVLPSANRFPFDPEGYWVRRGAPALYLWWNGQSRRIQRTTVLPWRERQLRLMYVLAEVKGIDGMRVYAGMTATIDAILHKASERQSHPSYGYNGAAPGTPIAQSLAEWGALSWQYDGGQSDFIVKIPGGSPRPGGMGDGDEQRGFPVLLGTFTIRERIDSDDAVDPTDYLGDSTLTVNTDDLEYMQRYLQGPDGSEDL